MKILLIPYENDLYNFIELAKLLKEDGHELKFLVGDFFSVITGRSYVKNGFLEAGFSDEEIIDLEEEILEINKFQIKDKVSPSLEYLAEKEKSFQTGRTYNHLIYADIYLSGVLHSRDYNYQPLENKNILYKFLELVTKKIDTNLEKFQPDLCFTFGCYNVTRNLTYELARSRDIRFFSLIHSRIGDYCIIYDNLGLTFSEDIKNEIKLIKKKSLSTREGEEFVKQIKDRLQEAYNSSIFYNTKNLNDIFSFSSQIKPVIKQFFSVPRAFLKEAEVRYRGVFQSNYFYIRSPLYINYYNFRNAFRVWRILKNKSFNHTELPKDKFIFFPLQTIPEDGVFTHPLLQDEFYNIVRLSKVIPIDYKIVVKVHSTMLNKFSDSHPYEWYKKISEIHNVYFVSPYLSGLKVIQASSGVASTNSTALLEGAVMGKPCFRFGRCEFEEMDGVYFFDEKSFLKNLSIKIDLEKANHRLYFQGMINQGFYLELAKHWMVDKETSQSQEFISMFTEKIKNELYRRVKEMPQGERNYNLV